MSYNEYPPVPVIPRQKDVWHYDRSIGKWHKIRIESINNQWWYVVFTYNTYSTCCEGEIDPNLLDQSKDRAIREDHYYVKDGKHFYYLKSDNKVDESKTYIKYGNQWK